MSSSSCWTGTRPAASFVDSDTIFDLLEKSPLERVTGLGFTISLKALDPKPNLRYQSAREFSRELTSLLSGQPANHEPEEDLGAKVVSTRQVLAASKRLPALFLAPNLLALPWSRGCWGHRENPGDVFGTPVLSADQKRSSQSVSFEGLVHDLASRIPNGRIVRPFGGREKPMAEQPVRYKHYNHLSGSALPTGVGIQP